MKTPLGTDVDLGASHIVLDGVPALCRRGTAAPPLFSADVYCGYGRPSQLLLSSYPLVSSPDFHASPNSSSRESCCVSFLANVNSRSRSLYAIAHPSVVCLWSVTFMRPTQAVEIFGNISTALDTLAIR